MMNTATLKVATLTDREIVMTRAFDAPRELVWEAWTNACGSGARAEAGRARLQKTSARTLGASSGARPMAPRWRWPVVGSPPRLVSTEGGRSGPRREHDAPHRVGWDDHHTHHRA
jgi:hypothetical protein